jgi:hypothetical protein
MGFPTVSVKEDGSFVLRNVGPENYTVSLYGMPENFYTKSVRLGDQEVLDAGLDLSRGGGGQIEIVLSPSGGQVEGVVLDAKQQPAGAAHVVLVPEPRRREQTNLYKTGTTDQYGRFTLRGITPGDYKLFAWDDIETGAYQDPDFLKPLENRGESVSIRENSRESAQLKLIPAEDAPAQTRSESSAND